MNTQKMKLLFGLFLCLLGLPQAADAYFTTAQTATRLTNDTVLYTVTYEFGFAKRTLDMPIVATRDTDDLADFAVGYSVLDNGEVTGAGRTSALVLASDPKLTIKDGEYHLPAGASTKFTLVVFQTLSDVEQAENPNLSLLVTQLPFIMTQDGAEIPAHLNPSELQYYHTPEVNI